MLGGYNYPLKGPARFEPRIPQPPSPPGFGRPGQLSTRVKFK